MKKYQKYFKQNIIPTIIFYLGIVTVAFGTLQFVLGNYYGGMVFFIIGGFLIFLKFELQVSDKQVDAKVQKTQDEYLERHIKGKSINKKELNQNDFSVFSGFIRDNGDVRFKVCRDGKVRTSKYYITAISVTKEECIISTTIYNLLSDETPIEEFHIVKASEKLNFQKSETEFPKGNYLCVMTSEKEFKFYLPSGDYLVEQLCEKINQM